MIKNKANPVASEGACSERESVCVCVWGEKPHSEDKMVFAHLWGKKEDAELQTGWQAG